MAQSQQQPYATPARANSPSNGASSLGANSAWGSFPPHKREQRIDPTPASRPGSPYVQSPYGMSPGTPSSTSTSASPHFATVQIPTNAYSTPYANSNGNTTKSTGLPNQPSQFYPPTHLSPNTFSNNQQHINDSNISLGYSNAMAAPGAMAPPPTRPGEKVREDGESTDVLYNTGVDLRKEEEIMANMYIPAFNLKLTGSVAGMISSARSFTQFPPGDSRSLYGAGPANIQPEKVDSVDQDEYAQQLADQAWYNAAQSLAFSRQRELDDPFLSVGNVHGKVVQAAKDNGLLLKIPPGGLMGHMALPDDFKNRTIGVQSKVGPDGTFVTTSGTFLPEDSPLVEQLALLSISTKHRLRVLLEDATKLARGRRLTSHGLVPGEWADAAAPAQCSTVVPTSDIRNGWESAVSPLTNPLKRSASAAGIVPTAKSDGSKPPIGDVTFKSDVASALRGAASKDRDLEEARLRKRVSRATGDDASRSMSVAPGSSGSLGPENGEKALTKKELKKKAEKVHEAATHAAANDTTARFLGGGGGRFGKRYTWLTGGASGPSSGTSTPSRVQTHGLAGNTAATASLRPERLTSEGVRRLGEWGENRDKGAGIQIRDWITVLEEDGNEKRALQRVYAWLDQSEPK